MTDSIICFHGSPGFAAEFDALSERLPESRVIRFTRHGYPVPFSGNLLSTGEIPLTGQDVFLGYSWGCVPCIETAVNNPQAVRGLILVSPYLFHKNSLGGAARALLRVPGLGERILAKKLPSIVDDFLAKTCSPAPVPDEYRDLMTRALTPAALRHAIFEKDAVRPTPQALLGQVRELGIPVALIHGDQDATSSEHEQFAPIREAVKPVFERKISGAGHALHWTHVDEVASAIRAALPLLA